MKKKGINLMKKYPKNEKEIRGFVDKVGLPLFIELTRIDNQQWVPIKWRKGFSISKKKWLELEELVSPDKLLKKKND